MQPKPPGIAALTGNPSPRMPWSQLTPRDSPCLTVFPRNPKLADLDVERNELAQTWKTFIRHLPPEDRVVWEERPQSGGDVQALVRNLQTSWASRARQRVFSPSLVLSDQFLTTLDTHEILLAVLPDPDRSYTSLLHGVLQSVIKVSGRYLDPYMDIQLKLSNRALVGVVELPKSDGRIDDRLVEHSKHPGSSGGSYTIRSR